MLVQVLNICSAAELVTEEEDDSLEGEKSSSIFIPIPPLLRKAERGLFVGDWRREGGRIRLLGPRQTNMLGMTAHIF